METLETPKDPTGLVWTDIARVSAHESRHPKIPCDPGSPLSDDSQDVKNGAIGG